MRKDVLGRTNQAFPPVWLSLAAPPEPPADGWAAPLVEGALAAGLPIDVSSQPALWGGMMRGTDATLVAVGDGGIDHAHNAAHAGDLVQASFVQLLSALGREHIDVYFLRVRRAREEFQQQGALEMLENLRQEGHIRFLGLAVEGSALAARGFWQFNDAFDVALLPGAPEDPVREALAPIAAERRVGVVGRRPLDWGFGVPAPAVPAVVAALGVEADAAESLLLAEAAAQHPVLTPADSDARIAAAVRATEAPDRPSDFDVRLADALAAYRQVSSWEPLLNHPDPRIAAGAARAVAALGGETGS